VTLQEARTAARILVSDFDGIIPGLIKAGREQAENFQNTCYITQTWKIVFDKFPLMPLELPKNHLQSLETVEYIDASGTKTNMDIADFIIGTESNRIGLKPEKNWPNITLQEFDSVIITFKAGNDNVTTINETVKSAIKLFVAENLDRPDKPEVPQGFFDLLWPERKVPV
jgi:uncharacterized phiE125 gp8 family phage protein